MNLSNINSSYSIPTQSATQQKIQHQPKTTQHLKEPDRQICTTESHKQPLTQEEVVNQWFFSPNQKDFYFFRDNKGILSEGQLYEFSLLALHRNWSRLEISNLFGTIKDSLSDNTLEALATIAINQTSFSYPTDILIQIKNNISQEKLVELASIVIKKAVTSDINRLLGEIKGSISQNKLVELASTAIEKMSHEYPMLELIDKIKDNISEDQLNNLRNQIKLKNPKECCTIM